MEYELPPDNRNRPDDELLADLGRVSAALSYGTVRRDNYDQHGRFSSTTLISRFGSWNHALELAGLTVTKRNDIPTAELISDLQRVAAEVKTACLTQSIYKTHGRFSRYPFKDRFGSWARALTAAGLATTHLPKNTDLEGLLANIERVWERIGRPPRKADMRPPLSEFRPTPYLRVFGSWRSTLEAFVAAANTSGPRDEKPREDVGPAPTAEIRTRRTGRNVGWRLRFLVLKRDRFTCRLCGASPAGEASVVLHVDHVQPWSQGGETTIENLQSLCQVCNVGKGADVIAG